MNRLESDVKMENMQKLVDLYIQEREAREKELEVLRKQLSDVRDEQIAGFKPYHEALDNVDKLYEVRDESEEAFSAYEEAYSVYKEQSSKSGDVSARCDVAYHKFTDHHMKPFTYRKRFLEHLVEYLTEQGLKRTDKVL